MNSKKAMLSLLTLVFLNFPMQAKADPTTETAVAALLAVAVFEGLSALEAPTAACGIGGFVTTQIFMVLAVHTADSPDVMESKVRSHIWGGAVVIPLMLFSK